MENLNYFYIELGLFQFTHILSNLIMIEKKNYAEI